MMKNKLSLILVLTMLLSVVSLGVPTAGAEAPLVTLTDTPSDVVNEPFETPTDLVSFGDPNGDKVINAKDALFVLKAAVCKHYHLTPHQVLIADVDRDDLLSAKDALEMLKHAVGKPSAIAPMEITLQTIWSDNYTANTTEGKIWKTQLAVSQVSYGMQTRVDGVSAETAVDNFAKAVMAGKAETDLAEVSLAMSRELAKKKVLANLRDSATLNYSSYNNGATQSVTFNHKVYGVSLAAQNTYVSGIFYNKELIARYAPDTDIGALYAKKEWTFDAFKALAKQCTVDLDEDTKPDIYGVTSNNRLLEMAISANAGGKALMKNGRVEATFCSDDGLDAVFWCKTLYREDNSWRYCADIKESIELFAQGKAAMVAGYVWLGSTIADTARFSMGFVPMPIGPAQTDYLNPVYEAMVYVVPKTNENRLGEVGLWLNGVAGVSDDLLAAGRQMMAAWGVDEVGCDAYEKLLGSSTADFSTGAFSDAFGSMVENLTSLSDKEAALLRTAAQQELDEYYERLYE